MSTKIPLGIRLNNPGNIRYNAHNRFIGLCGQENGFCKFESRVYGIRACYVVVRNYIRRGIVCPASIIARYAPPSENNTDRYIKFVCQYMGNQLYEDKHLFDKHTPIMWQSSIFKLLIDAIIRYEVGYAMTKEELDSAYRLMDQYNNVHFSNKNN